MATPILPGGAVADEADRVDRLARAARGDDDVPAGEVGVAAGAGERRSRRRIGGADRPIADGRDDRVDDRDQFGKPPDARSGPRPAVRSPARRSCSRNVAQPRDVGARRRMASTSRRPSPGRRRPAPPSRGRSRSRRRRPGRWPSRRASGRSPARRRSRRRCRPTTMWPIRPSGRRSSRSVSTGWRDRAANESGPTNRVADGVSMTATSAPSARSRRSSSTALYAAIEPVTPSPMSRPSSRPVTAGPARAARRRRPRRGGWPGP